MNIETIFGPGFREGDNPGHISSPKKYLQQVRRSGLVNDDALKKSLETFETEDQDSLASTAALACHLIEKGLLTPWQTRMLLQGRWRGFSLGKYKLLNQIGRGGMSRVFLAEHSLMKRQVAIKVLPRSGLEQGSRLRRFLAECRMSARLDHPNIVRAFHFDQEQDHYYLVMEFVDGPNLRQLVERDGPLPYEKAARFIAQTAGALSHAHSYHLIHRDVKPANLLLDSNHIIKLSDLGLAHCLAGSEPSLTTSRNGKLLGTADYVAPEQVKDSHDVDPRTDVYGLGCSLYFLLTGHVPFRSGGLAEKLAMHLYHQPPSIKDEREDAPEALVRICYRMMAKDPDDRYQTAEEIQQELQDWLENPHQKVLIPRRTRLKPRMEDSEEDRSERLDHGAAAVSSPQALSEENVDQTSRISQIGGPPSSLMRPRSARKSNFDIRSDVSPSWNQRLAQEAREKEDDSYSDTPIDASLSPPTKRLPPKRSRDSNAHLPASEASTENRSKASLEQPTSIEQTKPTTLPEIMISEEVAEYLRIPQDIIEQMAETGRIPCQRLGTSYRFHKAAIDAWLQDTNFGTKTWAQILPQEDHSQLTQRGREQGKQTYLTVAQLLENLQIARLLPEEELEELALAYSLDESATPLLQKLTQQKKLTDYQAAILGRGEIDALRCDHYLLLEKIGVGGMAVVYRAKDERTGKIVALKILKSLDKSDSMEEYRRFDREVRAVASLNHPNIVIAYDARHHEGLSYLVMEFVDGINLDQHVRRRGPLELREAIECILQVAQGLEHAHENHIVHRDIKPGNLLLDRYGIVKILDMGLVRFEQTLGADRQDQSYHAITQQGTLLGTPEFMAPEQFADPRTAGGQADIYSLGCTFYFLLTGKSPYFRNTPNETLKAHQTEPIPRLALASREDIPPALQKVFDKMLAKDLNQRYQTAEELIQDLNEEVLPAFHGQDEEGSWFGWLRPRGRLQKMATFLGIGAILGGVIGFCFAYFQLPPALPFKDPYVVEWDQVLLVTAFGSAFFGLFGAVLGGMWGESL
ncbi:Hypothetical protein PBC10988_12710 [Planctomycetales bacterium 10988]|nr:Hypothetical protein PBC10988_12710 [Planctomycetales bacterium 10988]